MRAVGSRNGVAILATDAWKLVSNSHSMDREGLMSKFSEFEVGRHHRQLIETRRAAIN